MMTLATHTVRGSIVVSIPACRARNRGSIPRRGVILFFTSESSFCKLRVSYIMKQGERIEIPSPQINTIKYEIKRKSFLLS
jgi:hypothetical protein